MDDSPYVGELRIFSFGFTPQYWLPCNGQLLDIQKNAPLYSLIGTTYGGNGQTSFALPDLQARVPIDEGGGFTLGQRGGEAGHTLTISEMTRHTHTLFGNASTATGNVPSPSTRLAGSEPGNLFGPPRNLQDMDSSSIGVTGGSQPHENRQPYLALNICICVAGVFPHQN